MARKKKNQPLFCDIAKRISRLAGNIDKMHCLRKEVFITTTTSPKLHNKHHSVRNEKKIE